MTLDLLHFYPAKPSRRPRYKAVVPGICEFYLVSLAEDGRWLAEHSLLGVLGGYESMALAMRECDNAAKQRLRSAATTCRSE